MGRSIQKKFDYTARDLEGPDAYRRHRAGTRPICLRSACVGRMDAYYRGVAMRAGTFGSYSAVHSKLPLMVPGLERQTDAPQQSESLRQRENGGKQSSAADSAAEESQSASSRGPITT